MRKQATRQASPVHLTVSTGETKLLIIRDFPHGGKPANINPERIGDLDSPTQESLEAQIIVILSNEKNLTIGYKASARHLGNFGSIDLASTLDGCEAEV